MMTRTGPLAVVFFSIMMSSVLAQSTVSPSLFPPELTQFEPIASNPVFEARGDGHWDVRIRERGWIIKDGNAYKMWFTGYDGTREGIKSLGYAVSDDGRRWVRHDRPIYDQTWIEDVMIVKQGKTYWMFAEGKGDQAQLLSSRDGVHWTRLGPLDVRLANGKPIPAGPYGTPTAWYENGVWNLFYERRDAGVWLARSKDLKVWTNVQDEPVLRPGPGKADGLMIALNQIVRYKDRYYAYYHGSGSPNRPRLWCTCLATSTDLVHWTKYPQNPLLPVEANKSSGIVIFDAGHPRLYTMHDRVELHLNAK